MLVPILLSLLWAVCSTVLIQPWFWKGLIKRKTLVGDENNRGWSNGEKNDFRNSILFQIFWGCVTLLVSLAFYLLINVRYNFYGSIIPILLVLIFQIISIFDGWNSNRGLKSLILVAIAVICLFFSITDAITSNFEIVGLSKSQEEVPISISIVEQEEQDKQQKVVSSSVIESLFKADSSSGPVYSNGKFVYTISNSPNGDGVVIINENGGETANFVACKFNFGMSLNLRQKYPYSRIESLNVVVSDDNVPFGKYALLSKPNMFGAPVLDKYILQNMLTGDVTEYTVETLPKFAQ